MRFGIHDLQDHLDSSDDDDNPQFNASTSFSSSSSNYSSPSTSDEDELGESSFLNDFLGRPGRSSTPNDKSLKNTGRGKRVGEQPIRRTERRVSSGRYGLNVRRLASDVDSENVRITDQNRDPLSPLNIIHTKPRRKPSHSHTQPSKPTTTTTATKRHVSQSKPLPSPLSKKTGLLSSSRSKGKGKEVEEKSRLMVEIDEWDRWDMISREEALRKAHDQNILLNTSIISSLNTAAYSRLKEHTKKEQEELEEVQKMLNDLEVGRRTEECKRAEEFEKRRRNLWDSIEFSIKSAEEIESKRISEIQRKAEEEKQRELIKRQEAERIAKANEEKHALEMQESARLEREAREMAVQAQADKERLQKLSEQERLAEGLLDGLTTKRAEWEEWVAQMREVKECVILRLNGDQDAKKGLNKVKRAITVRIGQVVNTRESILGITENIHQHLCAHLPTIPTAQQPTSTSIPTLPLEYAYLLSHIAKALIKQAEAEINAKPEAAYPLAKIIVGLMLRGHSVFGRVLFARIVKKCCWAVPYYPTKQEGQSDAEYMKSVGHKDLSPSETDVQYASRMSGILTLYFATCSVSLETVIPTIPSPPTTSIQLDNLIPSPFRIPACWSWLAGILRPTLSGLRPVPDFIRVALETMGQQLVDAYGVRQVGKIIVAIWQEGLGVVVVGCGGGVEKGEGEEGKMSKENVAGKASLRLFLQSFIDVGKFPLNEAASWGE